MIHEVDYDFIDCSELEALLKDTSSLLIVIESADLCGLCRNIEYLRGALRFAFDNVRSAIEMVQNHETGLRQFFKAI